MSASEPSPKRHECRAPRLVADAGGHGSAVDECHEDETGRFVASNDEYSSFVSFCPFCGAKAPVPMPRRPHFLIWMGLDLYFQHIGTTVGGPLEYAAAFQTKEEAETLMREHPQIRGVVVPGEDP